MYYKLWALCGTVAVGEVAYILSRPDFRGQRQYIRMYRLDGQGCIKFGVGNPLFIYKMVDCTKL